MSLLPLAIFWSTEIETPPAGSVNIPCRWSTWLQGLIDRTETVVCYVTGNGLKATEPLMSILPVPKAINADDEKILAVIK